MNTGTATAALALASPPEGRGDSERAEFGASKA